MQLVIQGFERDVFSSSSLWAAIAVIAICESIEKTKNANCTEKNK